MSRFRDLARQVTGMGYWTIPIFLLSVLGIVVGLAAAKSDYLTSYGGYMALGTRKAAGNMFGYTLADLIALAPQVLQLIFLYVIGSTDSSRKPTLMQVVGYSFVWFICFAFDTGTDVYFKAHGMPFIQWVIAFIESLFINTVVSEIALVVSLGLSFQLAVPAIKTIVDLLIDLTDMFVEGVKRVGEILGGLIEAGKSEVGSGEAEVRMNGIKR